MMIEQTLKDYLQNALGLSVYLALPDSVQNPSSTKFVTIEKTGSSMSDMLTTSTFAIQSYGETLYEAAELNKRVKAAVFGIVELNEITRVSLNGDYNFTDPETKRPRYQAVFDLTHYIDF